MINIKKYYSVPEAASILGISRVAVFNKIKKGNLNAQKFGRNYAISASELGLEPVKELTDKDKEFLKNALNRILVEYGTTLQRLAKE